jgi:2-oxoisovalerate dehydrogenase E1 component alpha subunit
MTAVSAKSAAGSGPKKRTSMKKGEPKDFQGLEKSLLLDMFKTMVKSRALEERLIKIYKMGEAFFWIGGPGEEAFGVPLGMLSKKGHGPDYDYFHLHYRGTPTVLALGVDPIHAIRLIMNKKGDVCTGGRNFSNHYCFPELNVTPVSSPIGVQYGFALGTARAQKRAGKGGISIVTGGDAGTAEGDFASCLVWASRPGEELPILITVQNNKWGISTSYDGQHGEKNISDRGKAFQMKSLTINGNDPVESYIKLKECMDYIRKEQKPVLLEAHVSRLFGHSSASGANPEKGVLCPIEDFRDRLIKAKWLTKRDATEMQKSFEDEFYKMFKEVQKEEGPSADTIWDHTFVNNENADWRAF